MLVNSGRCCSSDMNSPAFIPACKKPPFSPVIAGRAYWQTWSYSKSIQWEEMWSSIQAARHAGALVQAPQGFVFVWLLQALIQMEAGGCWMLERGWGWLVAVRGNAIAFAWCWAPLAADKHLWTSQAACNKQHGRCHQSPRGLGANWSATCSARPRVNISKVGDLEPSPSQVLWIGVFHHKLLEIS